MATAWFTVPYIRANDTPMPSRRLAIARNTDLVFDEVEILGNRALCKISGRDNVLDALPYYRLPAARRGDSLAGLTAQQQAALNSELINQGHTILEIADALDPITSRTLNDVLQFMASKRREEVYDGENDEITTTGPIVNNSPNAIARIDSRIR